MYTLGIDIGSTSSDAVILKERTEIVAKHVSPLGTGTIGPQQALDAVLSESGLALSDMAYVVATGYGRMNCDYANEQVSELSCHAKGVHFLCPDVATIIDIGGQDAKALRVGPNGQLLNFVMNDKCAAGTGRFLDVMSKVLNLELEDLGDVSAKAKEPVSISNTCTVFAESEVISHLSNHVAIEDIVAGIHISVAKRVAGMALRIGCDPQVVMSGGVALNKGVVSAMETELGMEVFAHPDCQLAGAIGAAIIAWDNYQKGKEV